MLQNELSDYKKYFSEALYWSKSKQEWLILNSVGLNLDYEKINGRLMQLERDSKIIIRRIDVIASKYKHKDLIPDSIKSDLKDKMHETFAEKNNILKLMED